MSILSNLFSIDQSPPPDLRGWRTRVLDGILRGIFVIWLFALAGGINNVIKGYYVEEGIHRNPLALAVSIITVYLFATALLALVTFDRKLKYELRAALLLLVIYGVGLTGLVLSSLSGDGRVFLFAFIVLAAILFDLRYALAAFIISLLTLIVVGWLEIAGIILVPIDRQLNATNLSSWLSGSIVFLALSVAALISITYLLQAFSQSLNQTRARASELETIAMLSVALRNASTVVEMIPILVRQAVKVVNGAYGSIFLLESQTGDLVSSGWYSAQDDPNIEMKVDSMLRHRPGEGITGYVVEIGQLYITEDIFHDPHAVILPDELARLRTVRSGVSLPLRAHEKTVGVLHIWLIEQRTFSETEIRLLTAIAEVAGNAIQRASLHEQTLQQADDLILAYDSTLEGWARALELRDEWTEGHTRRVTDLSLLLGYRMGLTESELVHLRRGATLHDIGKMALPDSILRKKGPLSAEQRSVMQRHPQYAYDMLSSIPFLRPALDVPLYHHEHWDGIGYPRGLKGEDIPLFARIFAVTDVWDAITSDRLYRRAWSKDKAREYIRSQSGLLFDPRVVDIFLSILDGE